MALPEQLISQPKPETPDQTLLKSLLNGRSEAEQKRVWQILAQTEVTPDDPMFLIMIAVGSIEALVSTVPETLARREKILTDVAENLQGQLADFQQTANDIVSISGTLEAKLKAKLPRMAERSTRQVKELLLSGAIAFLAGILFGTPLLNLSLKAACHPLPALCSEEEAL